MDPERASGELEGTTLGSSSRDGDRGSKSQRRAHSSSGFLVDSSFLPRSKSLRSTYHRSRHSEADEGGKRGAPELDIAPKKRSRFPWGRHKESSKDVQSKQLETTTEQVTSGPSRLPREDAPSHERQNRTVDGQPPIGLDRDSLQIVNLALNLNESRRRNYTGYPASDRLSGSRLTDGHAPVAVGSISNNSPHQRRNVSQTYSDDRLKALSSSAADLLVHEPSAVLNYLPHSAASDNLPQGVSTSTLARAARARRHFELFHEYLRLLPSLPPLKPSDYNTVSDSSWTTSSQSRSHRVYNPLQSIRNRKVRFRARCPIDTETTGWNDVEKVHNWINSVQTRYDGQAHAAFECLTLPPFQRRQTDGVFQEELDDTGPMATSPPSSLRRVSRTNSLKARRPRSDWVIFPDELLADAFWAEDSQNKSKIVDRDGNNLYPDLDELVVNGPYSQKQVQPSQEPTGVEQLSSRASLSDAHPRSSADLNVAGRGRLPRRVKSPPRVGRSSSASVKGYGSRRRKFRMRSRSSSSSSSVDDRLYRNSLETNPTPSRKSVSPPRRKTPAWNRFDEKRGSLSSIADDRYDPLSLAMMESKVANAAVDIGYFPSIASNLSPPSSRSPSPAKRGFTQAIASHKEQNRRTNPQRKDLADDSSPGSDAVRKTSLLTEFDSMSRPTDVDPSPLASKVSTQPQEDLARPSFHERRESIPHESKLRGIFKGPGKIAGKVGNEVSKMGDFILKKDTLSHSRKSSFDSDTSDSSDSDNEEVKNDRRSVPRAILRRFPTFSDDANRASPRNSDKSLAKNNISSPSPAASTSLRDDQDEERKPSHLMGAYEPLSRVNDSIDQPKKDFKRRPAGFVAIAHGESSLEFGPELHTIREEIKRGQIKDPSVPFSFSRPPVTGLAQAQPIPASLPQEKRPTMPAQTRSWSISDRSLSALVDTGVPGKPEVERTRALLLSSGIKAREISRRAESVRNPPPDFLQRAFGPDAPIPPVPRVYEHELASQNILKRVEVSHNLFQQSLERIPKTSFAPLRSQLVMLEELVGESLNRRVHAATQEAENLSIQLNTTSTLAVKQLSETLDKGIRRRHRRLRWLRRTAFVILEWSLVAVLWWVWFFVVAFKIFRKLLRGVMSGVKWVLWL